MRDRFDAACFPAGEPGSRPCSLALESQGVRIECADGPVAAWPYDRMRFETAGDEQAYLLVSCDAPDGAGIARLALRDRELIAALADRVRGPSRDLLAGFHRRRRATTGRRWRNLLIFAVASALLAVGGWIGLTRGVADWAARKMPVPTEVKWGKVLSQALLAEEKLIERGPAVEAVRAILDRLTGALESNPGYPFDLHVADKAMVNAMALPGGQIVVYTGLLKEAESAEEVAGVLAHEIQHVLHRHVVKRVVSLLGGRAVLAVVFGGSDLSTLAAGAGELLELSYSREQEVEADREAVRLLARAGIPSSAMLSFFEKLRKKELPGMPELISTHPDTARRIETLKGLVESLPAPAEKAFDIDWETVRDSLR